MTIIDALNAKKVTKELIPKETFNESILNLNMVCKNRADLCTWTGKFKDYKEHLTNYCPKEYINCPNKECVVKLLREQMPEHLSKCEFVENICSKCHMKYSLKDKEQHKNTCLKEIIKCPKGCEAFMERKDIKKHKDNCPNEPIECPYKDLGCDDKFPRKDIKSRRNKDIEKHLYLAIDIIRELEKENSELKKEIGITKWLTEEVNNLKEIIKNKVIKKNNEFNLLNKSQIFLEDEEKNSNEPKYKIINKTRDYHINLVRRFIDPKRKKSDNKNEEDNNKSDLKNRILEQIPVIEMNEHLTNKNNKIYHCLLVWHNMNELNDKIILIVFENNVQMFKMNVKKEGIFFDVIEKIGFENIKDIKRDKNIFNLYYKKGDKNNDLKIDTFTDNDGESFYQIFMGILEKNKKEINSGDN
jgi:hypothetical protein